MTIAKGAFQNPIIIITIVIALQHCHCQTAHNSTNCLERDTTRILTRAQLGGGGGGGSAVWRERIETVSIWYTTKYLQLVHLGFFFISVT